jgi:hypothetical protein
VSFSVSSFGFSAFCRCAQASSLAFPLPRRAVRKFNLDAIHWSIIPTDGRIAGRYQSMFAFFSNRLGCLGSIVVSVIATLILLAVLRGCH